MILHTKRLTLREFVEEDWQRVLAYQSDPQYLRFYPWNDRSEADVKAFIKMFLDSQEEHPRKKFQFALCHKDNGLLFGSCGIRINNLHLAEANIGYELDSQYWGKGYATEAAKAILQFGFENLGMHRIWATTIAGNIGSVNVLKKIGMRQEAREREKEKIKGFWMDRLTFAILDWEWQPSTGLSLNQ